MPSMEAPEVGRTSCSLVNAPFAVSATSIYMSSIEHNEKKWENPAPHFDAVHVT